jgi:hypothetical protein
MNFGNGNWDFGIEGEPAAVGFNQKSEIPYPKSLRDYRVPRDWRRPWRDPPGFLLPNCPCCSGGAQMYSLGGEISSIAQATADKTDMSAETTAAVTTANLTVIRMQHASVSNPGSAGYVSGGQGASSFRSTSDKVTYSNDTTTAVGTATISQNRNALSGLSERSTKGYVGGGTTGAFNQLKTADILTYSSETDAAATTANLSQARYLPCGMTEGTSKGYWGGGDTGGGATNQNTIDKITFSSDTTAVLTSAALATKRGEMCAGSDGSTKGYFAGGCSSGQNNPATGATDKLTFSTDTSAALTAALFQKGGPCAAGSNGNKLIGLGGIDSSGFIVSSGLKITFATDAFATTGGGSGLSTARYFLAGVSTVAL